MAEPTSTGFFTSLIVSFGLVSAVPLIDDNAVIGAVLGAWLVTSTKKKLEHWQRLGSLSLSSGVGYLFAPMTLKVLPFLESGGAAWISAICVIPLSIKLMEWMEKTELFEIFRRLRGGGN